MIDLYTSRERFEELGQTAYDNFDTNFRAGQDDLAVEFEHWKQLQNG